MQQDDLEMLTVKEVAKIMKVNIRTVRAWVQSGELSRIWIGKREYRISKADLRAFAEKRKGPYPPGNVTS
jgi:excisionase family DNA binding protein